MINSINQIVAYIKKESTKFTIKQKYRNTRVDVYSNELYALKWLENHHVGYFDNDLDDVADVVLYGLYENSENFHTVLNVFSFKDKMKMFFQHEGYYLEEQTYKIFYDSKSHYIHIIQENVHFLLILNRELDNFRIIERIQREILFGCSGPHIRFHAASICNDYNEGTLIVGYKGIGKTTLSLGAIAKGAKFGANDRTEVYANKYMQIRYCGVPTSVRLSEEQVRYFQQKLGKRIKPELFDDLGVINNKIEYTSQEISQYFNTEIRNNGILKNIVIPKFSLEPIKVTEVVDTTYIYEVLYENTFLIDKAFLPYFISNINDYSGELLFHIIEQTKCYVVEGWLYDFNINMIL